MTTIYRLLCANLLGAALLALPTHTCAADKLIHFFDLWYYLDNGMDPGTAWRQPAFVEVAPWDVGLTQFGFGEDDESTPLNPSHNTAYFRNYFTVPSAGMYSNLTLHVLRDDGAVVYINGVEVFRSNMPTGTVNYATKAVRNLDDPDELVIAQRVVPASVLVGGRNSLAVEIHQATDSGDDMSFAMEVIGHRTGENQPPSANPSFVTVEQDKSVALTLDASDPDSDPLTYHLLSAPLHGSLSGVAPNLIYTPAPGYNGPDLFSFEATDGQWTTEIAEVGIDVKIPSNHPPVADGQSLVVDEDNALTIVLTANDPDGDPLSYSFTQTSHGTVTSGPGHSVVYQPTLNYFGPDSFTFTVNDGNGGAASASIVIAVASVNDAPAPDAQNLTTLEDTDLDITLSASDVEGDALTFSHTQPAHGTVTGTGTNVTYHPAANYNGPDSFTFSVNDGNGGVASASIIIAVAPVNDAPVANAQSISTLEDTSINVTLSASDVDGDTLTISHTQPAHGTVVGIGPNVTYYPAANYSGSDSFTFTVNDGNGAVASASINIAIAPVNDAPAASSQSVSTSEDSAIDITLSASDVEGDALTYSHTQPAHGTLTGTGANITYHPDANYNGPDSFTFTVDDGNGGSSTATVNVQVTPVNDAPVAAAREASAFHLAKLTRHLVVVATNNQSAQVYLDGSASTDIDGDPLSFAWYRDAETTPFSTAASSIVPFAVGSHVLNLAVSDGGAAGTDSITLQVVTPSYLVKTLASQVQAAAIKPGGERNNLLKDLNRACTAFDRRDIGGGVHELNLFQAQVTKKIAPHDAALAQALNNEAQHIIQAVACP